MHPFHVKSSFLVIFVTVSFHNFHWPHRFPVLGEIFERSSHLNSVNVSMELVQKIHFQNFISCRNKLIYFCFIILFANILRAYVWACVFFSSMFLLLCLVENQFRTLFIITSVWRTTWFKSLQHCKKQMCCQSRTIWLIEIDNFKLYWMRQKAKRHTKNWHPNGQLHFRY